MTFAFFAEGMGALPSTFSTKHIGYKPDTFPLLLKANLSSHLYFSQLQYERRRSLTSVRDDRYVVDYEEEEAAIRNDILFMKCFTRESPLLPPISHKITCHPEFRQIGACGHLEE